MVLYIVLILTLILICVSKIKKEIKNFMSFIIVFTFMAIRYDIGWDFRAYYLHANDYYLLNYDLINFTREKALDLGASGVFYYYIEPLNKLIYILTWITKIPQLPIIIYSYILTRFIYLGLKSNKSSSYPWLLFISMPIFMFMYFGLIRQAAASAIIFYSLNYLFNEKIKKFILLCIIASLLHKSALFMIVLIPLKCYSKKLENIKLKAFLFLGGMYLGDLLIPLILKINLGPLNSYKGYLLNRTGLGKGGNIIFYLILLLMIINILFSIYINKMSSEKQKIINNFVFLGGLIYISFIKFGHAGPRLSNYFMLFLLYQVDEYISFFRNKKLIKVIYIYGCCLIMLSNLIVDLKRKDRRQYIPYKTIFFADKEEFKRWE